MKRVTRTSAPEKRRDTAVERSTADFAKEVSCDKETCSDHVSDTDHENNNMSDPIKFPMKRKAARQSNRNA